MIGQALSRDVYVLNPLLSDSPEKENTTDGKCTHGVPLNIERTPGSRVFRRYQPIMRGKLIDMSRAPHEALSVF